MNLNQELQGKYAGVLIQSTTVRWLSLYSCLESVRRSVSSLSEIFDGKKMDKTRINVINVSLLDKLVNFLKPWGDVMKRTQSSLTPSIHTVTPSMYMINSSLEVKTNDAKNEKGLSCHKLVSIS